MNINDKEPNRSNDRHDGEDNKMTASQKVKEAIHAEASAWDANKGAHKHHGDKEANTETTEHNAIHDGSERSTESEIRDDANAEYMDHQDMNETKDADFDQPQPMSEGLSSIYPGRPSTKEEREALAKERMQEMKAGNRKQDLKEDGHKEVKDPMAWKNDRDGENIDHERGNSGRHSDDQERKGNLGIARGEVPSGHRDPNFSPARQNYWGDEVEDDEIFGDHDHDDQEVRRKQDEGARPWDTTSDYESEYDMDDYDERDRKPKNRRRQQEDEFNRQSYKHKTSARAFHKDRRQHYTDENE